MKEYTSIKVYGTNLPSPWYEFDDPFEETFKTQKEYVVNQILETKQKIRYEFDCHGFRKSSNFNDSKLWFFGCSHTFGESLNYENCFSKIVSEKLQQPFYNFGTPGASINLIARLLFKLRNQLTDKKIIIFLPYYARFETKVKESFIGLNPKHKNYNDFIPLNNLDGFLEYNILQSSMLIKSILGDNALIMANNEYDILKNLNPVNIRNILIDIAEDGWHYGYQSNKNIANFIIDHIKL